MAELNKYTDSNYSPNYYKLLQARKELPVWSRNSEFKNLLKDNQFLIVVAETGSGKTTQIPQWCIELSPSNKPIVCTQTRRVAACSIARRVAEEMEVELGREVGFSIRFDNCTSSSTLLTYITDGMLLRELLLEPQLDKYSIVIVDDAHERTLNTDLTMAILKQIAKSRKDLKVVVMSATLDTDKFQKYLGGAPLLHVQGRSYPIEIFYTAEPEKDYVEAVIRTVMEIHLSEEKGDILVFLTGQDEIEDVCDKIKEKSSLLATDQLCVLPLYGMLTYEQQKKVFSPSVERKCIVATNIAETSLTIEGVVYVVDSGFCKQKIYNARMRMESLLVTPISKASAKQRAGRAGRVRPGKCFRLFTEDSFKKELLDNSFPELLRSNLTSLVLLLFKLGYTDLVHFDFIDPPATESLLRALELLNDLGILDKAGKLTKLGEIVPEFPLDPQLSKMLITSSKYGCSNEMLTITAMLSIQQVFVRPSDRRKEADECRARFENVNGDHLTLLDIYNTFKQNAMSEEWCVNNFVSFRALSTADKVREQLSQLMVKLGLECSPVPSTNPKCYSNLLRTLVNGFFTQVAHLEASGKYLTIRGNNSVLLHPSTGLTGRPKWVIYNELVLTTQNYIRTVSAVEPEWLVEEAPDYFSAKNMSAGEAKRDLEDLIENLSI